MKNPIVGIVMGSDSDLEIMSKACEILDEFKIPYECSIVSAHRTQIVYIVMLMRQYIED